MGRANKFKKLCPKILFIHALVVDWNNTNKKKALGGTESTNIYKHGNEKQGKLIF